MYMTRRLKFAVTFFGIVFMFILSILLQNFAILIIFGIAYIFMLVLVHFKVNRLKVAVTGVTVFFVLSFGIPNKIPTFGSGCVFATIIIYYGIKWYSLKPLRELAKKERMEHKRTLNNVWAVTKSILQEKPDGAKPKDILPEVMKATGLGAQKIYGIFGILEANSKILKKNSRYYLAPVYVRILEALEVRVYYLVLFYLFAGLCAYLLILGLLVYIVVFEWILQLPFIPWWSIIQQVFSGGPATIGLGVFLGIGLLTYLMQYAIDNGWRAVKEFAWKFAKRATLIIPQLAVAIYILLVWFRVIMPVEPFVPAFLAFIQSLGIFSVFLTLPTFLYCIFIIIFSALSMALANDDDITLKAPLLFLPMIIYIFIAEEQHEVQSHYSYIKTVRVNPIAQMDFIRQRMYEKAMFEYEEKMRLRRSKI